MSRNALGVTPSFVIFVRCGGTLYQKEAESTADQSETRGLRREQMQATAFTIRESFGNKEEGAM